MTMDFTPSPPARDLTNYKSKSRYPQFKPKTEYFRQELDYKSYLDAEEDLEAIDFSDVNVGQE